MAETLTGSQRLRAFIAGLNGKIAAMEAENEKWVAEAQRLETENRTLGQSVEGGNTRISKLEAELNRTEDMRVDAEHRNTNLQTDIAAANKRVKELEAEIAGFQGLADEYAPAAAEAEAKAPAKG